MIARVIDETPYQTNQLSTAGVLLAAAAVLTVIAMVGFFRVGYRRLVQLSVGEPVDLNLSRGVVALFGSVLLGLGAYFSTKNHGTSHDVVVAERLADSEDCPTVEETISAGIPPIARLDLSDIRYACGGRVAPRAIAASGGNITVVRW